MQDDLKNLNIDICIVTETFLRPSVPDSFITIDNYCLHRRDREVCRCKSKHCTKMHKGGGILIYVHSRFTSEIFDVSGNCESFWIKLSQASNSVIDSIFINPLTAKTRIRVLRRALRRVYAS